MRFSIAALTFVSAAQAIDLLLLAGQYSSLIPTEATDLSQYALATEALIGVASTADYSSYYDQLQSTVGTDALSSASSALASATAGAGSSSAVKSLYGAWNSTLSAAHAHTYSNSSNSSNSSNKSSSSSSSKALGASQAPYVVGAALAGLSVLML